LLAGPRGLGRQSRSAVVVVLILWNGGYGPGPGKRQETSRPIRVQSI
jgi:hypothetical protein